MQENYKIMRIAMRQRAAMIPYIYTEARAAYDTGMLQNTLIEQSLLQEFRYFYQLYFIYRSGYNPANVLLGT